MGAMRNLLQFFAIFAICFCSMELMLEKVIPFLSIKRDAAPDPTDFEIFCQSILEVSSEGEDISIRYKFPPPAFNSSKFNSHFSLITQWSNQTITFPQGSSTFINISKDIVNIKFFLPVVDSYSATLTCSSSSAHNLTRQFHLNLTATEFISESPYSRFACYDNFLHQRYCEGRNIIYAYKNFMFLSPATFSFPVDFITAGSRPYGIDYEEDRLAVEPIVIQFSISTFPSELQKVTTFSYIYGVFYNLMMLWHSLYDFIIPLYSFMHRFHPEETNEQRLVFLRSQGIFFFPELMPILSHEPIRNLHQAPAPLLFRHMVIGIKKPVCEKPFDMDSVFFADTFDYPMLNNETAPSFRSDILKELGLVWRVKDASSLVIVINRTGKARGITNGEELFNAVKDGCKLCDVRSVKLEELSLKDQILLVAQAKVLIGCHGSGLAHVAWMAPQSHLIEIFPYKYTCRMWYKRAASVANVQYHPYFDVIPPKDPSNTTKYGECYSDKNPCGLGYCHSVLRDQSVTVDLEAFNKLWKGIVDELRGDSESKM